MKTNKQLASRLALVVAVSTLVGASAFAEERHSGETRADSGDEVRRDRGANDSERTGGDSSNVRQGDGDRGQGRNSDNRGQERSYDRSQAQRPEYHGDSGADPSNAGRYDRNDSGGYRGNDHGHDNRSDDRNGSYDRNRDGSHDRSRGYDHSRGNETWRGNDHGGYRNGGYNGSRAPYYVNGRVSRVDPWNGGYRVWLSGAGYPFFIPEVYYRSHHFGIGLSIRLGGIYNPLGYYDYYDENDGYYGGGVYSRGAGHSNAALRGVVESVDYRRDTFVMRNEATGSFVTVAARHGRREVQTGDYVEISGDWTRSGLFEAYEVALLDDGYRR